MSVKQCRPDPTPRSVDSDMGAFAQACLGIISYTIIVLMIYNNINNNNNNVVSFRGWHIQQTLC